MKLALFLAAASLAGAQDFTQRGFLEFSTALYPRTSPQDSGQAVGEGLLRYEAFYKIAPGLQLVGGFDARTDTHHETDRTLHLSWWDRERRRPAFEIRRASATYSRGKWIFEAGKQFLRWGKTDVLSPTDRFAPRDFLTLVDADFIAIPAARLTFSSQSDTVELIFAPRLTPSRIPLLNQRWSMIPARIPVFEAKPDFPGGTQEGVRWNHIGAGAEFSLSMYNGYDHLPLFRAQPDAALAGFDIQRFYPQIRMYGGDLTAPMGPVSLKAEAGYFTSQTRTSDEYALYVLQLERQAREWLFVAGYAGEVVTRHGQGGALEFSPQRGLSRSAVARASYTIDVNRSASLETVVRQNGRGAYAKAEYSQALGQHWRATASFVVIRGEQDDFIGQYRRNCFGRLVIRYSF